jgi:hypothetical protein
MFKNLFVYDAINLYKKKKKLRKRKEGKKINYAVIFFFQFKNKKKKKKKTKPLLDTLFCTFSFFSHFLFLFNTKY